jgi:hypothetical protein
VSLTAIDVETDPTVTEYNQLTQLEGIEYLLSFYWSDREAGLYLSLLDQDQNPIAVGIKLVLGSSLLAKYTDPRLPPGILYLYDTSGQGLDIQALGDLGTRIELLYLTSDELPL